MTQEQQIRWGLVGCGDIARKRVAAALQSAPHSRLLACLRKDGGRLEEFQSAFAIPRGYTDYADFLDDDDIDAVYVATPVYLHCAQTIQAAEKGKHVLCEKPMAMNSTECLKMIEACRSNRVKLGIAYYRRFYPIVNRIKQILETGLLGEPILARTTLVEHSELGLHAPAPWRFVEKEGGGGLLMDMASHRLDVLAFLFGLPSTVTAYTEIRSMKIAVEDTASLLMRYGNGLHVMAFASHCIHRPMDDFEIFGTRGQLKAAPLNGDELHVTTGKLDVLHLPKAANVHLPLVEDFAQAVLNNSVPRVSGEEGMKASMILDAAYQSAREGKTAPVEREPGVFH